MARYDKKSSILTAVWLLAALASVGYLSVSGLWRSAQRLGHPENNICILSGNPHFNPKSKVIDS